MTAPTISFWKEVGERIVRPPWNDIFLGYIILFFAFTGSLGVYLTAWEVYHNCADDAFKVAESIATFFVAVTAGSLVDLNLHRATKNVRAFLVWSSITMVISAALLVATYILKTNSAFIPAGIGLVLSVLTWIVANSKDRKFQEDYRERMSGQVTSHMDAIS